MPKSKHTDGLSVRDRIKLAREQKSAEQKARIEKKKEEWRPTWQRRRGGPAEGESVESFAARRAERLRLSRAADELLRERGLIAPSAAEIKAQREKELAEKQRKEDETELLELISDGFVGMLERLDVKLSPAQRVLCLVCFDGWQPNRFSDDDRALFTQMFGPIDHVPPELLRWLTWVIGGRSGKSWLGSMALLYRALAADLSSLAPGEEATALIVSPELRLARHALRFIRGMMESRPLLERMLRNPTTDSLRLQRPDGYVVAFEALPASKGGGSVRARTLVGALLDEVAFFRDEDYAINDRDIYQAVSPRVTIPGGFTLASSTPWGEAGLLYEEWRDNYGHPTTGLVAHVSTGLMRSTSEIILQEIEHSRRKDPRNAEREFDAKFGATDDSAFFAADDVSATTSTLTVIPVPTGARCIIVVDASLSQSSDDRFGWCVVTAQVDEYMRRANGETHENRLVTVHEADAWEVDRGPREMAQRLRDEVCVRYSQFNIIIDQFSDVAFAQLCADVGVIADVVRWVGGDSDGSKAERYRRVRTAQRARQVLLCNSSRLRQDMSACRSKLLPGGGESIGVPRTRRGHGDVLSAVVLGISEAFVSPGRFAPAALTPEQQQAEIERKMFRDAQRRAKERRGHQWR